VWLTTAVWTVNSITCLASAGEHYLISKRCQKFPDGNHIQVRTDSICLHSQINHCAEISWSLLNLQTAILAVKLQKTNSRYHITTLQVFRNHLIAFEELITVIYIGCSLKFTFPTLAVCKPYLIEEKTFSELQLKLQSCLSQKAVIWIQKTELTTFMPLFSSFTRLPSELSFFWKRASWRIFKNTPFDFYRDPFAYTFIYSMPLISHFRALFSLLWLCEAFWINIVF